LHSEGIGKRGGKGVTKIGENGTLKGASGEETQICWTAPQRDQKKAINEKKK